MYPYVSLEHSKILGSCVLHHWSTGDDHNSMQQEHYLAPCRGTRCVAFISCSFSRKACNGTRSRSSRTTGESLVTHLIWVGVGKSSFVQKHICSMYSKYSMLLLARLFEEYSLFSHISQCTAFSQHHLT